MARSCTLSAGATTMLKVGAAFVLFTVLLHVYSLNVYHPPSSLSFLTCLQQLKQRPLADIQRDTMSKCRALVERVVNNSNDTKDKDVMTAQDCYKDLEHSKQRPFPFKDAKTARKNYLENFAKCGHAPIRISEKLVSIDDDNLLVPNVVHHVWFYNESSPQDFLFTQYLSLLSVSKYVKPQYILWHGNVVPRGVWWDRAKTDVPNIFFVLWNPPGQIFDKKLPRVIFASDIVRLWVLMVHGGIYIHPDILVLKSFDPLRKHPTVMGQELGLGLTTGVILAEPWATHLRMMLEFYQSFDQKHWPLTTMGTPKRLSTLYPHKIHVVMKGFVYPTWPDVTNLYKSTFDWRNYHCVQILGKERYGHLLPSTEQQLGRMNLTLGTVMRRIYYNDTRPAQ